MVWKKMIFRLIFTNFIILSYIFAQQDLPKMTIVGTPYIEQEKSTQSLVRDANGDICSSIKIISTLKGLRFDANNGIVRSEPIVGGDIIYISPDERVVEIFCKGYVPYKIVLSELKLKMKMGQSLNIKIAAQKNISNKSIAIVTDPTDAELVIIGIHDFKAKSPFLLKEYPHGTYSISITKDKYFKCDTLFVLGNNTLDTFFVRLKKSVASIAIVTDPSDAEIAINGMPHFKNKSPFEIKDYPHGIYSISITKDRYFKCDTVFELGNSSLDTLYVRLKQSTASIIVQSNPSGAKLVLSKFADIEMRTPFVLNDLSLGNYPISLIKYGYITVDTIVSLTEYVDTTLSINLPFISNPEMVFIEKNSFVIGKFSSTLHRNSHNVYISNYYLSNTEITKYQWEEIRKWASTRGYKDLPYFDSKIEGDFSEAVTSVSWYEAIKWCNAYSEMKGLIPVYYSDSTLSNIYRNGISNVTIKCVDWKANGFRLPTEAEWEYAAREGGKDEEIFKTWNYYDKKYNNMNYDKFTKNKLGIYGLSDKVSEWCFDVFAEYDNYLYQDNPRGPYEGEYRIIRGGSDESNIEILPITRFGGIPNSSVATLGFRIARSDNK